MSKTFTLSKDLLEQVVTLQEAEAYELLDDGPLIEELSEAMENERLSPPDELMGRLFAYSRSVEVHASGKLRNPHVINLN